MTPPPLWPRLGPGLVALLVLTASCKKKEDLEPVHFDEDAAPLVVDSEATLAPAWPAPGRAILDNELQLYWLQEEDAARAHFRLLLPTAARPEDLEASSTLVVLVALQDELRRRLRGAVDDDAIPSDIEIHTEFRAGRAELSVHADALETAVVLDTLADLLGERRPGRFLARAHGLAVANTADLDHVGEATARLGALLLGLPLGHERVLKSDMASMSRGRLEQAWAELLDPRHAVLLVHAPDRPETAAESLARLGAQWRSAGSNKRGRDAPLDTLQRVHPPAVPAAPEGSGFLLGDPPATLWLAPATGRDQPVAMLGRLISTPDPTTRARARLAHRILQQDLDARLVVSGPVSMLLVRIPLSRKDPRRSLSGAVENLEAFATAELTSERLEAATRLWLGARVVEASFEDEDWTRLFSDSIDLADADEEIPLALARDARLMLETTPSQLAEFNAKWLHPRKGEAGWSWIVVGADEARAVDLAALTATGQL